MTPLERLVDALERHGCEPRRVGDGWQARCPAHDDRSPSLSASDGRDGNAVTHCHAGCTTNRITAAVGLTVRDLFASRPSSNGDRREIVARYAYVDEAGRVLFEVVRLSPKSFRQRRPDGRGGWEWKLGDTRRVLYRLPEVVAAVAAGSTVLVVEGEKDADALAADGWVATCNAGGAGKWDKVPDAAKVLAGANLVIVADRDEAGYAHARQVAASLRGSAASITVAEAAAGKDAADHLAAGLTVDRLGVLASTDRDRFPNEPTLDAWLADADRNRGPQHDVDGRAVADDHTDTPHPEDASSRRLRLTAASTIRPRPVRWVWWDRVPAGELTLTPGRGGIGKSTFHAWVIAALTRGQLDGCHDSTPRPCVIAATEDSWDRTIVPRLIAAGADLDRVFRADVVTEHGAVVSISLPVDLDDLEQQLIAMGAALLSVDPLLGVVSDGLDTHKDREVRAALQPLAALADRTGVAVLGNAHFNKSTGSDPLSAIMGSAAFGNVARAALGFALDPDAEDGSCVISQIKNNLGRLDLPSLRYRVDEAVVDTDEGPAGVGRLVMLGQSDRTVADILRDGASTDDERSERSAAAEFIRHFLIDHDGTAPAGDVLKAGRAAGFGENTLKKARRGAGAQTTREGFGADGGWYWTVETPIGAPKVPKVPGFRNGESMAPMGHQCEIAQAAIEPADPRSDTADGPAEGPS